MPRKFMIIDRPEATARKAFVYCQSRVDMRAISPQLNLGRVMEPIRISSIQVLRQTTPVSLINPVLVTEVGRNLGPVSRKSIATRTTDQ
jgi:hypothetical protein